MTGQLFVISGPSGAGKSTVIRHLMERMDRLEYSVSHTSRAPREGERDGVHYHFVDADTFRRMIDEGAFVEWARVYRDYYGTSFSSLRGLTERGLDVVMDADSQGAANIRKHFRESVLIFLLPPSLEELERRLRERATDDEGVIRARFEKASGDIRNCAWYDYIVINDDLDEAIREAESIIVSERSSRSRRLPEVEKTFNLSLQK
jgi:guanylate kinase